MQAQILSLQCSSPLTRLTLSQIFLQFSPARVGLKELAYYVQINDEAQGAEFVRMVKNGAYPEVKPQIYEILANTNSESDCFKNCAAVLSSLEQVVQYYLQQDSERMFRVGAEYLVQPEGAEKSLEKESEVEVEVIDRASYYQDDTTILFKPIYEPSSKFEVEFEDNSPLVKEREEPQNQIEEGQASDPTSNFEVLQAKKEVTINVPASPTTESPLQAHKETTSKKSISANYYLILVLFLWVGWMII